MQQHWLRGAFSPTRRDAGESQHNPLGDNMGLPSVSDPEKTFAHITRQDYMDYLKNFRDFEERLLALTEDDSLIKQARVDQEAQNKMSKEIQQRNIQRYGGAGLSAVQRQEQTRALQRGGQLGMAGSINNARVQQRQVNSALLNELIGIGQGVNQTSLAGMGDAASLAASRAAQYRSAKAQHHSNKLGFGMAVLGALI